MLIRLSLLAACLSSFAFADLASDVTIRRDTFGVPHILGKTEEAAGFGMGFAQAEDHCVEMGRRFLAARGESAKYLGGSVEGDFTTKRYGTPEFAREKFPKLSPLFQKIMNAYAAGFNLYVRKHRAELPAWMPELTGIDVLAQGRAEIMRFAFHDPTKQLQEKYPNPKAAVAANDDEDLAPADGSNMWGITGSRTKSGKPILLGNPHQAWNALYWEAQITVPGKLNFFGGTFIGRPMLTTGFNEHLGWTHTVNYPDLEDAYALVADPKDENRYVFDGKSMPLTRREVTVEVKGGKTERRTYWDSHLGPVIHRAGNKIFALKSAALQEYRYYEEWYELSKAKNLKEFQETLKMNAIPMFNLTYADVDGNVLYLWNGTVPKRIDDGTDYRLDVPGDTSKYVWQDYHGMSQLPQLLNPSGGYVQNCNDAPWWTSLRNPLDPKNYPSYFEPGRILGLRTQMSLSILEGQEKFSLEDIKRLKFSTNMLLADRVKPDLLRALKAVANPSGDLRSGIQVMEAWDNHASADSRGAVLFERFWQLYTNSVGRVRVAFEQKFYATQWDSARPAKTPSGIADGAAAVRNFEEAVKWTRETYGSADVKWGDVNRFRFGDLDLPGSGAGGEWGMFRVLYFDPVKDGKGRMAGKLTNDAPNSGYGDAWITTVEFSKPIQAYSILAYGETGNLASKHSRDQAVLFAKHELKKVWFTEKEILANLERAYHPGE